MRASCVCVSAFLAAAFCASGIIAADNCNTADADRATLASGCTSDALDATSELLGRKIEPFTLKDFRGKAHSLADYEDSRAVVLFVMGTECPLAKLYAPKMQELAERFAPQGVAFLGVSSNVQDSITELAAYARIHGITFPILKDLGNHVADALGATRTPEVFVLDAERVVRYCGRIDAQFTFGSSVGVAQPQAQRADLEIALDQLLAGKDIAVPLTEVKGCIIGRARRPDGNAPVTYTNQIARIFQSRCLECHRQGQIAPFAMSDYAEVAGWGEMIAEVVRERRMPPWHANPAHGHFANENRLSDQEKQLIYAWVDSGCPEGDPSDLPPPRTFHARWFMPREPDCVVYMTEEPVDVKAEGVEPYRNYTVDPGFTEDKWVKLSECMPGNPAVVHHIIVFVRPPGHEDEVLPRGEGEGAANDGGSERDERGLLFLSGFAPGTRPLVSPPGWAKYIPAGSKLVFQMHYTPIGSAQTDRSSVGLVFVDAKDVTHEMSSTAVSFRDLEIPPHEANYQVECTKTFRHDVTLLSLFPHMHMRGKSFRYELREAGADAPTEVLLDVPQYDFNWQNSYVLAQPRRLPAGSVLRCTATFDNSAGNLANPNPSETIRWGPQTWDEMMIGWHEVGIPIAESAKLREPRKP